MFGFYYLGAVVEDRLHLKNKNKTYFILYFMLASPKFPFYNAEYYKVLPYIVELRNHGADKEENEIETCFNALYGVMMLRLQQKEITPNTQAAVKEITTFIGMLNDYYLKDKAGDLVLNEE